MCYCFFFFFSSRRRHTRWNCDWSSDVCSSDLDPRADMRVGDELPTTYERLATDARVGSRILLNDGLLSVEVTGVDAPRVRGRVVDGGILKIGRASCRERVEVWGVGVGLKRKCI